MKLCADDVIAADNRSDGPTVIGFGNDGTPLCGLQMKRVHESRRAARAGLFRSLLSSACGWLVRQRIPAHMRNFQTLDRRWFDGERRRRGSSRDPELVSNSRPRVAKSCIPTQMPRNGRCRRRTDVFEGLAHARNCRQATHTVSKGTNARQNDTVCRCDHASDRP